MYFSREIIHRNGSRSHGTHGEHICTEEDLKRAMKALVRALFCINIEKDKRDRLDIAISLIFAPPLLLHFLLFFCTKESVCSQTNCLKSNCSVLCKERSESQCMDHLVSGPMIFCSFHLQSHPESRV